MLIVPVSHLVVIESLSGCYNGVVVGKIVHTIFWDHLREEIDGAERASELSDYPDGIFLIMLQSQRDSS